MREIKLRIYWEHQESDCFGFDYFDAYDGWKDKDPLQEPIALEQFTCLRDKNGNEIYEGDIIQDSTFKDRGSYIMTVEWEKESASFVLTRNGWAFRHYFYESCDPNDCTVIGNIHENPELLK